ncbi:hypothetical protein SCHPADRAFT_995672 [Schizopora paradoxa]|uniref:Uncharacterized protein n=1 Tax=Schizopora paradoxa TaxID=27342 RepID=A0A0H2SF28_9AGAM|nr:hypothetical protein SCHPADRAFT_995672 [Schizopora paradoxa]
MNWRFSRFLLFTSFILCYEFVGAQDATTTLVLTTSLGVPIETSAVLSSRNVFAAVVKGNGEDENNDGDDGDDGDDPEDATDADSDSDSDSASNQVDAATKSSSSSSSSTPAVSSSATGTHSTNNKPQEANTNAAATKSHSHTTHSFPSQSTHFSFHPHPIPTSSVDSGTPFSTSPELQTSSHHGQPPAAIAFEVIGGLALLALILCCARCAYKYRRVPARDRVALILDRHRLERELEEMEEAQPYRRRTSLTRPPPPAYQNAPAYDEAISDSGQTPSTETSERSEHEEPPQLEHPP